VDYADVVQQVHQDYLRVGAEIIISNNFWTTRSRLSLIGQQDQWERLSHAAGENAIRARDAMNPNAYVFGGIAAPYTQDYRKPYTQSDLKTLGAERYAEEFKGPGRVLANLGVDALLAEYVGYIEDCVAAVDALATIGLPVFLGVRHITDYGWMQYGETLTDLAKALEGHPVEGVLLMCSKPECISVGLMALSQSFDGVVGAYANVGYNPMAPVSGRVHKGGDLLSGYSPLRLSDFGQDWLDMGAQIVGGCCATGPEHIIALKNVVSPSEPMVEDHAGYRLQPVG
jgi:S-methylmethionine-dependent homocysteine/selenocysteine methylase